MQTQSKNIFKMKKNNKKDLLMEKLYETSKKPYQKWFKKNTPWNYTVQDLIQFPAESLGNQLGLFLDKHHFEIQEKLEDHDAIHVLTNTGISVVEEIGMQFFLLGNGKKSLYLFMVVLSGWCCYPNHISYFINEYKKGKKTHRMYDLEFLKILHLPLQQIREALAIIVK